MSEVTERDEIEDLEECAQADRVPEAGRRLRVRIDDDRFVVADPVITGRQLLDEAGKRPVEEFLIFLKLSNGLLEEIRLDETVDLRQPGVERFLTFKSDRSFRFELDGRRFEWGAAHIAGLTLKELAGVDAAGHGVWLERTDEPDQLLADDDTADLSDEGVERFRTRPVFQLCLEGAIRQWPRSTITTEELARLGGWDPAQGVIEVDEETQDERTLAAGEVITLKPGLSFAKKLCWKRGREQAARIEAELELLGLHFRHVEHTEASGLHWFRVEGLRTPEGWTPELIHVAFSVTQGYPGAEPYGFFVPADLAQAGAPPSEHQAPHPPPFPGNWRFLSWQPEGWRPTADVQTGSNLWGWVRSFMHRLREGR